ncbi:hypothetical protein F4777DRAFT_218696 [Nemania sp. FL0916]|nr:hypothetical protein F4777DRAFT_218696 [Nemania sp. FL0916]
MAASYEGLLQFFFNPRFSDLEIFCEDGLFKFDVHRRVIAMRSPILNSMVTEHQDDLGRVIFRIELPDVEYMALYMALQFFYSGDYKDYETIGSFHSPSYVVYLTNEEIQARLETLPCLPRNSQPEVDVVDDEFDDGYALEELELKDIEDDTGSDESLSDGDDTDREFGQSQEGEGDEDEDGDDQRTRTFKGHNLFDSIRVYCFATRFSILPLKLLARDRFYRTAEKVLMFSPNAAAGEEEDWSTDDDDEQRVYQLELAKAIYEDFPRAVEELYKRVPASDTVMRAIPPMLIAAGYNNDQFRDDMRPLLENYPDLALAVVGGMRMPHSQ